MVDYALRTYGMEPFWAGPAGPVYGRGVLTGMSNTFLAIAAFVLGSAVGSFLNVCIYRIPEGKSVVTPPSSCPACGARIPFYHNIPIVSYLVLRGRCSSCSAPISIRYPLVELLTGLMAAALALEFGPTVELPVYFVFISALIVVTFIDLDHRIIPDVVSIPGVVLGLGFAFLTRHPGPLASLIGAAVGAGVILAIAGGYYLVTRTEGMGMGDAKLLAMVGAFLGWKAVVVSLILGSFMGALVGVVIMASQGKDSRYAVPFGPFLSAGAAVYLFFGPELVSWYLGTLGL